MLSIPNKATIVPKKKNKGCNSNNKEWTNGVFLRLGLVSQQLRLSELFINSSMFVY